MQSRALLLATVALLSALAACTHGPGHGNGRETARRRSASTLATRSDGMTEVVIIGTFHGMHFAMKRYHPDALRHLIDIAEPDVLGLELREDDMAAPDYGKAPADIRHIAIPWAIAHDVPFRAIDAWEEGSREAHGALLAKLKETEAGRAKLAALPDEIEVHSDRFADVRDMTVAYVHSDEFAAKDEAVRREHTEILGEGPGNLFWQTRTEKMLARIDAVIEEFRGRRVVIVTGAAHRGDFERGLASRPGVVLLPMSELPGFDAIPEYSGTEGGADELLMILFQHLESREVNRNPDGVDAEAVRHYLEIARSRAEEDVALGCAVVYFEGMLAYAERRYDEARSAFRTAMDTCGETVLFGVTYRILAAVRVGHMLDLLGRREEALVIYRGILDTPFVGKLAARYLEAPFERPVPRKK